MTPVFTLTVDSHVAPGSVVVPETAGSVGRRTLVRLDDGYSSLPVGVCPGVQVGSPYGQGSRVGNGLC